MPTSHWPALGHLAKTNSKEIWEREYLTFREVSFASKKGAENGSQVFYQHMTMILNSPDEKGLSEEGESGAGHEVNDSVKEARL